MKYRLILVKGNRPHPKRRLKPYTPEERRALKEADRFYRDAKEYQTYILSIRVSS